MSVSKTGDTKWFGSHKISRKFVRYHRMLLEFIFLIATVYCCAKIGVSFLNYFQIPQVLSAIGAIVFSSIGVFLGIIVSSKLIQRVIPLEATFYFGFSGDRLTILVPENTVYQSYEIENSNLRKKDIEGRPYFQRGSAKEIFALGDCFSPVESEQVPEAGTPAKRRYLVSSDAPKLKDGRLQIPVVETEEVNEAEETESKDRA